ncbi:MAG: aminoacyl-tRNA hydrolase [Proteobacteria bacterium]|nr:aminoacyl-tRNA hydrolase [Pseudomonadota bacterium]
MILFVGLGNPGNSYAKNRHNVGFMVVEALARAFSFSPFKKRFQGQFAEGKIGRHKVFILKPETFMNRSGPSVSKAVRFYKIPLKNVYVFYDELDLTPGKVRLKEAGGAAGHNGLRSLIAHVGEAFKRVRIGIGHPGHKDLVHGYVLTNFPKAEQVWVKALLEVLPKLAPLLVKGEDVRFQNDVALHMARSVKREEK